MTTSERWDLSEIKKQNKTIKERGKVYQNIAKIIHSWLPFP